MDEQPLARCRRDLENNQIIRVNFLPLILVLRR